MTIDGDDMYRDDMIAVPPQAPPKRDSRWHKTIIEYVLIIVCAIGLALLIQAFIVKPYRIPSVSMTNTLKIGDRVLVDRVVYHLRKPHRGDIVVFNSPPAFGRTRITLIKRIIGLPGDTLKLQDGAVYINGRLLNEPYVRRVNGVALPTEPFAGNRGWSLAQPFTVPAGHYFVMGDNREQSDDSRDWGPIAKSDLIGVAFFKYWPLNRLGGL